MIVIHHVARVLGILIGLAVGAVVGVGASAWAGIVIGAGLGISVGFLSGALLPETALLFIRLALKWSDSTKLRARLDRENCLSHLIIAELISRGESVEQFRGKVESMMRSDSAAGEASQTTLHLRHRADP